MVVPSSPESSADSLALEAMLRIATASSCSTVSTPGLATGGSRTFVHYGDEDRDLSFEESLDLSARLAGGLAALGVVPGDRVAVFLTNPLVTVLTMLAVWRLDAVYCPINYGLTGRLLAHPLRELEARLLVTEEGRVASLDDVAGELAGLPPCVLHRPRRDQHDLDRSAAGARPRAAPSVVDFDDLLGVVPRPALVAAAHRHRGRFSSPRAPPVRARESCSRTAGSTSTPSCRGIWSIATT